MTIEIYLAVGRHKKSCAPDGFDIQLIPTAEGINYLGLGKALLGVPGAVGELDVFDRGAVLVIALDGTNIHASL